MITKGEKMIEKEERTEGIDNENIDNDGIAEREASFKNSGDSTPVNNENKTESNETEDFYALVMKKMESENLSFMEAQDKLRQEKSTVDASPNVKVDLEKEIQLIAFKDRNPNTGKFGWNYPFDFQRKLKDRYPNTNFELDDIKKVCMNLMGKGILHGKFFEYGQKYVFERRNLKV